MLSGSESFSPSAFMNLDTRGALPTFGGVNQYSETRPMNLRSRADLSVLGRYIHPTTPAKTKRGSKRVGDIRVKLFLSDNVGLNFYCGDKVGKGSNMQACVATSSACHVTSHATKAESFEGDRIFIRTPVKAGRTTIYLDPSVSVETMSKAAVTYLLSLEFPVKFWSSLLPHVVSCDIKEIEEHLNFQSSFGLLSSLISCLVTSRKSRNLLFPLMGFTRGVGISSHLRKS